MSVVGCDYWEAKHQGQGQVMEQELAQTRMMQQLHKLVVWWNNCWQGFGTCGLLTWMLLLEDMVSLVWR